MYRKRRSQIWNQDVPGLNPLSSHMMALFSVVQSLLLNPLVTL